MKVLNLVAVVSSAVLLMSGAAHADVSLKNNAHNQNFISKRSFQQVVENKAQKKDQQWEGATLIADQASEDVALNDHKTLRLNMLSKRPY
ncbi:MAG: hypothetical protein Q8N02_06680 [Methylotenera sp.]|nr:hypothetical protein [Methylotenera sp.]MDO9233476.1 hypothetical protein [Methylotenera sp.]MDO9389125.1 hypothetical protein [Methylotenera sp.]MDP2403233.1 hypothetical protein [Methylotenera sp.]MDP3095253.1 hypothetical protein [Methylotenera sp.]